MTKKEKISFQNNPKGQRSTSLWHHIWAEPLEWLPEGYVHEAKISIRTDLKCDMLDRDNLWAVEPVLVGGVWLAASWFSLLCISNLLTWKCHPLLPQLPQMFHYSALFSCHMRVWAKLSQQTASGSFIFWYGHDLTGVVFIFFCISL